MIFIVISYDRIAMIKQETSQARGLTDITLLLSRRQGHGSNYRYGYKDILLYICRLVIEGGLRSFENTDGGLSLYTPFL